MTAHDIVGGVVWVQLMVLMAALVFAVVELCFVLTGQRRQFRARRQAGFAVCASLFVLPFVLPLLMATPFAASMNATDAVVAQYLKGNIAVSAMDMHRIVEMRATWALDISSGASLVGQVVFAVFLIACLWRLAYLAVNVLRIRRALDQGWVLRQTRRLKVVASPHITVPFTTRGLWRYYIVLPEALLRDRNTLAMTLGHEVQHIRQGDVVVEILTALVSPLFLLNPGYWYIAGRVRKLGELSCDRAYLARRIQDAHGYALRLLNIARQAGGPPQPSAFGVPLTGRSLPWIARKSMLRSRILEIAQDVDQPKRDCPWLGGAVSLALGAAILTLAMTFSKPGDWSHERIMLSTVVNLERTDQLNTLAQRSW